MGELHVRTARNVMNFKACVGFLCLAGGVLHSVSAQVQGESSFTCATHEVSSAESNPLGVGGKYITASGTLRILLVFVSFPDDETAHPYWPAHNPPLMMREFIDQDTATHSQGSFNLTNYFQVMSLGKFHLVGDVLWVETSHSQDEYRNGSYGRANLDVLHEKVDPVIDFSLYDGWSNIEPYNNTQTPDGIVDMIVMIWRTNIFQMFGEASLGYKTGLDVDGKRIEMGFPENINFPLGSGVTCEYPYTDDPVRFMRTMVHEMGHWLLGGPHPYNGLMLSGKHEYWGILCNSHKQSSCANAYDRESLGWITVAQIPADTTIKLPDFVSTGAALKYHPPNGDPFEYWYFENHQLESVFDDVTTNGSDKGLWILHQRGPYMEMDNLRIRPSDGIWQWDSPATSTECFDQPLPVFIRGIPEILNGESHRDQIPTATSAVNWLYIFRDALGNQMCGLFCSGYMFSGAFRCAGHFVFSPFSNPPTTTWLGQPTNFALEVVGDSEGVLTVHRPLDPLDTAPACRYLGINPDSGDLDRDLSLAWGGQWAEGQPLEPDVVWSELESKVGDNGTWTLVYSGPETGWRDTASQYGATGSLSVQFRVRVKNTQGKYSSWSNTFFTAMALPESAETVSESKDHRPPGFWLKPNFPNPFNPSTAIEFSLDVGGRTTLQVYDMVGRLVVTLVDGQLIAGVHRCHWDGKDDNKRDLASGVYFIRIIAGSHTALGKMLLLR